MRVEMISWTQNPIGTLLDVWDLSKSAEDMDVLPLRTTEYPYRDRNLSAEDIALFRQIIDQEIPVSEHITFNFAIEDAPISWREQAVRHRVGFKKGDNYAVDMFPEDGATFWSQSMRLLDMSSFAADERYFTPESIAQDAQLQDVYDEAMMAIGDAYRYLVEEGVPLEDARNLIPVAATSRIMMAVNLRTLKHIMGKRGCWILQSSLWSPIIRGVVDELATKIHPVFREMIYPPCVTAGRFTECKFKLENIRRLPQRLAGDRTPDVGTIADPLPVCPLYWTSERPGQFLATNQFPTTNPEPRIPEYAELWNQPRLMQTWEWENRDDE